MERLGRYLLVKKLATGGMAEIFLALLRGPAGFEKKIVIKKILPQWAADPSFISMLVDEAKIAVELTHPHIVPVYELAREGETYYIAMEYLDGADLRKILQTAQSRKKKIPLDISLTIASDALEGLAYAHGKKDPTGQTRGIIHRDISPQNILVSSDGTSKITDFGIAKAISRNQETATGVLKGKFAYMSPEQANQETLDARSDIFSMGVVLYELFSGERLFYRNSELDTLEQVRRCDVSFSPAAEKRIPSRLQEILLKMLAKNREGRYPDALAARDDLLRFARRSKKDLKREKIGSFLQTLLEEEKQDRVQDETRLLSQETALLLENTKTDGKSEILAQMKGLDLTQVVPLPEPQSGIQPAIRQPLLWAGGILVILLILAGFFLLPDRPQKRETVEAPVAQPASPAPRPQPPEISPPTPPVRPEQAVSGGRMTDPAPDAAPKPDKDQVVAAVKENGFLSIQAIPWGKVTLDRTGKQWETPIRRIPLSPGRHFVKVLYEPDGSVVQTHITIRSGHETACLANFREGREIRCEN